MRIDKYLANMNVGSRKEVHSILKQGVVTVNGEVVTVPKKQVKETDEIAVNGNEITYKKYHYFLLNNQNIAPVGRLDKDTTGLLLLTNDGPLAHELLAPNKHVAKVYQAQIAGVADQKIVEKFAQGLILGDGTKLKSAKLKILEQDQDNNLSRIEIEIQEGKYHQIKRMFGAVGMKVLELDRISMGKLHLPADLKRGEYKEIDLAEIK